MYAIADFGGSLTLSGNRFSANVASSAGGAFVASQSGPAIISGNVFRDNSASVSSESGGGGFTVFSQNVLKVVNNLIVGNETSQQGGGAVIHVFGSENQITNNTCVGNGSTGVYDPSGSLGGGLYVVSDMNNAVLNIYNNIIWGNTAVAPRRERGRFIR